MMGKKASKRSRKFGKKGHLKKVKVAHQRKKQWKKSQMDKKQEKNAPKSESLNTSSASNIDSNWMAEFTEYFDEQILNVDSHYSLGEVMSKAELDDQAQKIVASKTGKMNLKSINAILRIIEEDFSLPHLQALIALMYEENEEKEIQLELYQACAKRLPDIFEKILLDKIEGDGTNRYTKLKKSSKWKNLGGSLHDFLCGLVRRIAGTGDQRLDPLPAEAVPLLYPFPTLAKGLVAATVTNALSASTGEAAERWVDSATTLARLLPTAVLDCCFKALYLGYLQLSQNVAVSACKHVGTTALKNDGASVQLDLKKLQVLRKGLCEAATLNPASTYLHVYVYFEGCARKVFSIKNCKSSEKVLYLKLIYELEVLASMVLAHTDHEHVKAFLPLILQVVLDLANKCSGSSSTLELRLKCVKILHQICDTGKFYCPSGSLILSVLEAKTFFSKKEIMKNALDMLKKDVGLFKDTPGFVEYSYLIVQELNRLLEMDEMIQWKPKLRSMLDVINIHTAKLELLREKLGMAPKDSDLKIVQGAC